MAHAGVARLYARMRMHTPTRPVTHMHTRTRKHARTDQYVIFIAFPQQQLFRERVSVLRYTYIVCLVLIYCTNVFSMIVTIYSDYFCIHD